MFRPALLAALVASGLAISGTASAQTTDPAAVAPPVPGTVDNGSYGKRFGRKGVLSLTNEISSELGYVNIGGHGVFVVDLLPGADFFVMDHLSIGGNLGFAFASYDGGTGGAFVMTPRIGYQVPITPAVDIWPRGGMQLSVGDPIVNGIATTGSETRFGFVVDAPIIYHLADHFFLGLSPTFFAQITGDNGKLSSFTFNFIMGGWIAP